MQQATVNLFADMGVQPGTLMGGLAAAGKSLDLVVQLLLERRRPAGRTRPRH
jgi:hypothetical protein